ncbi:SDR family NAD(P)-dependent oxidoreductase [Croceicoccus estronivorus]|uniref:SDR family NAD(P)-dependent oxidoreductase n=1 Tax=Croceicoccus estronivorus TaxID=1172626 RepID=UPI001F27CAB9|nr:SDR family NAD(P)-dependent oxidoreductase [Croceicoccus estronivorus]
MLENRVAIVTGASRGIGAAIAIRFAAEGARVVITARTLDESEKLPGSLRKTQDRIEANGGECFPIVADLGQPESRRTIVEGALAHFGRVDILVNNAAWARFGPTHLLVERHIRLALEVNTLAPLELASAVAPGMIDRGEGWILDISSGTSDHPGPGPFDPADRYVQFHQHSGPTLYAATKAATERLATGMAAELAPHNIAVNTLAPVEGVASEGAVMAGDLSVDMTLEPVEAMAEAALALCSRPASMLSGRRAVSLPLLEELGIPVHTLDGRQLLHTSAG